MIAAGFLLMSLVGFGVMMWGLVGVSERASLFAVVNSAGGLAFFAYCVQLAMKSVVYY